MIFALKTKCALVVDVAQYWLIFSLFCVYQLNVCNGTLDIVEPVQEHLFYLFLVVNGFRL